MKNDQLLPFLKYKRTATKRDYKQLPHRILPKSKDEVYSPSLQNTGSVAALIITACSMQAIISNIMVNMFYALFFAGKGSKLRPWINRQEDFSTENKYQYHKS